MREKTEGYILFNIFNKLINYYVFKTQASNCFVCNLLERMVIKNGLTPEDDNKQLQKEENQTAKHLAVRNLLQPDIWHHSSALKCQRHPMTSRGLFKIRFALLASALL